MIKFNNKTVLIIISVIVFYSILIVSSDISGFVSTLQTINWELFSLSFPLVLLSLLIRGYRYDVILRKLGIVLGVKNSILLSLSGLAMLISPGGIGSIIKSVFLKKKTQKTYSSTIPIVIFEKWLELVSNVILIGIFLLWQNLLVSQIIFSVGILLTILIFLFLKNPKVFNFINSIFSKIPYFKKFVLNSKDFSDSVSILLSIKLIFKTILVTLISKIVILAALYFIFQSFDVDLEIVSIGQAYFTSMMIGVISFIPGGIIIVEGGLLGLLLELGLEPTVSSSLVLMIRFSTFWFGITIGIIALRMISKRFLKS